MKTLIVPTDFSPIATNAMNYAVDMALSINASVLLLHVYQVPVTCSEVPVTVVTVEEMKKMSEEKLEELKQGIKKTTSGKIKVYTEARLGDVVDEIEALCKSIQPFAVIMGTKGASVVERLFLGSSTLTAIRHLTWPVIIVPPGATFNGIRKIGFACDFKKVVETTPVKFIKDVVKEFNAELHVLNVDYNNKQFTPATPEESLLLHTMLEELKPGYHFINNPNVEEGINKFAEENNLGLIIVIPKKHKLLDGLFQKSHSKEFAFHSHIPILAVHE